MFTGIIQSIGAIKSTKRTSSGISFTVASRDFMGKIEPGDSVSINGVCQTVEDIRGDEFTFTAVGETLKKTTMTGFVSGIAVNLERAATPETALGGHMVQGHVDCVGKVTSFSRMGADRVLSIRLPREVHNQIVPKGSIAIDGVSLTVMQLGMGNLVKATVIPFTLENTIIGSYRAGTMVNIETDIIGKYVLAYLAQLDEEKNKGY